MKYLLDTCVVIDWLTDPDSLDEGVWDILNDGTCPKYMSAETGRELVVQFNNKKMLHKYWKTADQMLRSIQDNYEIEILPVTAAIVMTYSRLRLNTAKDHKDPSDHVIIAHAIAERLTLISSDTRFPFYRNQGLDLIEY